MPKALSDAEVRDFTGPVPGCMAGAAWGGVAGAVIGAGVSLSIDLFTNAFTSLNFAVIGVSIMLGAMVGYVMASLLADDSLLRARPEKPVYMPLKTALPRSPESKEEQKNMVHEEVAVAIEAIRASRPVLLKSLRPDTRAFDLIVAASHKKEQATRR